MYEVHDQVPGSGAGVIKEVVQANSDYQARRIIMAKFPNAPILKHPTRWLSWHQPPRG